MEEQRERARAARKSEVVRALDLKTDAVTEFTGYDVDECAATVLEVSRQGIPCSSSRTRLRFTRKWAGRYPMPV
mgnify:CR=1 FL=1